MEIGHEVVGHLNQQFAEIERAIRAFPEGVWSRQAGPNMLNVPCFLAHHTVWCMALPHMLRIPEDRLPHNLHPGYGPGKTVTREQVLDLLGDIRAYTGEVYGSMPNEAYLAQDEGGATPLGRVLYTLAHTRHHYGQLTQILRAEGLPVPDWYPLR